MLPNIPPNPTGNHAANRIVEQAAPHGEPTEQTLAAITDAGEALHQYRWLRHYDALHDRAVGVLQDIASRTAGVDSLYELRQLTNRSPGGASVRRARQDAQAVEIRLEPEHRAALEEAVSEVLTTNDPHDFQRAVGEFLWHALGAMGNTPHGLFAAWFITRSMLAARGLEAPRLSLPLMETHRDYTSAEWYFLLGPLLPAHAAPLPLALLQQQVHGQPVPPALPPLPDTAADPGSFDEASYGTPPR